MATREITEDDVAGISRLKSVVSTPKIFSGDYRNDAKVVTIILLKCFAGFILIWLGLTNTGSFYTNAGQFSGLLATIFYEYQAGTLMTAIGSILIYDAVKSIK